MNSQVIGNQQAGTLPASLHYIVQKLQKIQQFHPSVAREVIAEADVRREDLLPWADLQHPLADSYGRKMVHKDPSFEVMVMSWAPGDFSAIHDHGQAEWGAVQIFGAAEHATFRMESGILKTIDREQVRPGEIVKVGCDLIHQMGNPSATEPFLSLHVYGSTRPLDDITADARLFDLDNEQIQRVNGGVFFGLPAEAIERYECGPKGDFPTRLSHLRELIRRLQKMEGAADASPQYQVSAVAKKTFSIVQHGELVRYLQEITDENDHHLDSVQWRILNRELQLIADLQKELKGDNPEREDHFHRYAALYDGLICRPCLDGFMGRYLAFFREEYGVDFGNQTLLSLGCGTGLVEQYMIDELGLKRENIAGIDLSAAMVAEAQKRIPARVADIFDLDPETGQWDLAFSGLNVFHYLNHRRLEDAVRRTAEMVRPGGYFIGDFITPDHIRWYPNAMYSANRKLVSLRTPRLIEKDGYMFQESEILNLDFTGEQMEVNYAGKHLRHLPSIMKLRRFFTEHFGGAVRIYDAHSLQEMHEHAETCPSTRYFLVAQKE